MADFEVVALPEVEHLEAGDTAPAFTRPLVSTDYWEDVSLGSLLETGPVLLFAHPMDGTGQAKGNWITIRERGWGDGDVTVVGLSISTPYEHKTLIDRHHLPYRLFSDPGAGVAEAFGIPHDYDGMAGIVGHRPSFFLVEPSRRIAYAWVASRWPAEYPFDAVEAALESV